MDLNAIFMNRIAAKAEGGGYTAKSSVSDQNFGSFMNKAVNKNANNLQNQSNAMNSKRPDNKTLPISTDNKEVKKESISGSSTEKTDTAKPNKTGTSESKKSDGTKAEGQKQPPKDKEQLNEEVIEELSEALNIPAEVILQVLAQMNITALELGDGNNLQDFMQNILAVDDVALLLDASGIEQAFEAVQEVLSQSGAEETTEEKLVDFKDMIPEPIAEEIIPDEPVVKPIADELANTKPINTEQIHTEQINTEQIAADTAESGTPEKNDSAEDNILKQAETPTVQREDSKILLQDEKVTDTFQDVDVFGTGLNEVRHVQNTAVKAEAASSINTRDVIDQILEKMKVEIKGDVSEIKLTLRPEHLGDVSLKISTENGIVTASFIAENQRVKEVIESSFDMLKDALAGQGIQISQLSVSVGQNEQQRRMGEFARGQRATGRITRASNARLEAVAIQEENYSNPYDILDNSVDFTA